jgi:hypothetical protein
MDILSLPQRICAKSPEFPEKIDSIFEKICYNKG